MTRKTLTLILDLESAALADGFGDSEAAMILRTAAAKIEAGHFNDGDGDPLATGQRDMTLMDTNGNAVGTVQVTDTDAMAAAFREAWEADSRSGVRRILTGLRAALRAPK